MGLNIQIGMVYGWFEVGYGGGVVYVVVYCYVYVFEVFLMVVVVVFSVVVVGLFVGFDKGVVEWVFYVIVVVGC